MSQYPAATDFRRWPAAAAAPTADSWRREGLIVVLAVTYSTLLGGVMGLVWPRVAPHIDAINAYYKGSVAANKALLGDDVWFGFLGILAAIVCVVVLWLSAGDIGHGPGAVVGLAAGGVLGSLVAAHLGTAVQQPHLVAGVHAQMSSATPRDISRILYFFNFRLRIKEMLLAWPMIGVVIAGVDASLRLMRDPAQ